MNIKKGETVALIGVNGSGKHNNWSITTDDGSYKEKGFAIDFMKKDIKTIFQTFTEKVRPKNLECTM